jgi:hypothetical protein
MNRTAMLADVINAAANAVFRSGLRIVKVTVSPQDHALFYNEREVFLEKYEAEHGYPHARGSALPLVVCGVTLDFDPHQTEPIRLVVAPTHEVAL